ncbi:MAG: hypothetical protein Q7K44_03470 [Candidatus Liptonbacteria bacterium]|nr:hypothetical protein [Candidatus Liptonbacteria bacterium]
MGDVIKVDFGGDKKDDNNAKDSPSKRDLIKEGIASVAKEFPVPEIGRLNKMVEAARYISSLAGTNLSMLRAGSPYKDNVIVFQNMYSQNAKEELYGILENSSEEKWKTNPGYYLALIDVLRGQDILY